MTEPGPAREGFFMPAEWTPHAATWLAWPAADDLWQDALAPAQRAFVSLCAAVADAEGGRRPAERVRVLVRDAAADADARRALAHVPVELARVPYGDIWLRDTAPIFVRRGDGAVAAARFGFNGWGGKYVLPHDAAVAAAIAELAGTRSFAVPQFVLEGGSIEVDGEGTCLTTRQCLLNHNRNPGLDERAVEERLREGLGVRKILWLDEGLRNDHTDGHIDTLARFVAPGVVACMRPGRGDPNRRVLEDVGRALAGMTDVAGRRLRVASLPSPGEVLSDRGELMPASYANFYVAGRTVIVPAYGVAADGAAREAIAALFPGRRAVAIEAKAILTGGGAFHCITQQQPAATA